MMLKFRWIEDIYLYYDLSLRLWIKLLFSLFMFVKSKEIKICGFLCLILRIFNKLLLEDCGI